MVVKRMRWPAESGQSGRRSTRDAQGRWSLRVSLCSLGIALVVMGCAGRLVAAQEQTPTHPHGARADATSAGQDSSEYFKLASSYSADRQPEAALKAITMAVDLDPSNVEYLSLRGELATWASEWVTAQESYLRLLALVPETERAKVYFRLAQAYSGGKDPEAGLQAVRRAVELEPMNLDYVRLQAELASWAGDATLAQDSYKLLLTSGHGDDQTGDWIRLAHAYSAAKQPSSALEAIGEAVTRDPANTEAWRFRADLATWAGEYDVALESYSRILESAPEDGPAQLGVARVRSWTGEFDEAVTEYDMYLARHPTDQEAWLEFARVEGWRENYAAALKLLEKYRGQFGSTEPYWRTKARILAWAGRPSDALAVVEPRLKDQPDDYDLNLTRSIALAQSRRPRRALESLDILRQLDPDRGETAFTEQFVGSSFRPSLASAFSYYHDSNGLEIFRVAVSGGYALRPELRIVSGIDADLLRACPGSGLERVNGGTTGRHARAVIGFNQRFSSFLAVDGRMGAGLIEGNRKMLVYRLGFELNPADSVVVGFERDANYYVVSPRAVDLGVKRAANQLTFTWHPGIQYSVYGVGAIHSFSDGNQGWELTVAPQRSLFRRETLNLDIGFRAYWFGFRDDLDHGYYDPHFYQSYALTSAGYWKLTRNDGLNFIVVLGQQKDDASRKFQFSGNAYLGATFGLYRNLFIKVGGNLTYGGLASGAYRGTSLETAVTWRF